MRKVTFLLFNNMLASSLTLPLEMLNAADNIHRSKFDRHDKLTIQLASKDKQAVVTSGGLSIMPNVCFADVVDSELVIIPGLWRSPIAHAQKNAEIPNVLIRLIKNNPSTLICAVGTGSIFLAESGLIDEKAATTHWYYFKQMKKRYPSTLWKQNHLITQSGNIYCTSSVNSIADLTVRLIEIAYSRHIARRVESQFSPEIRKSYDDFLFDESSSDLHTDEVVASIQAYIQKNSSETINFSRLAHQFNVHYRSLQRRFKQACGYSLLQYQQILRVKEAKELLRKSDLNIQDIAEIIGYIDASHFSSVFKKHTEQNPKQYREAVKSKLFRA